MESGWPEQSRSGHAGGVDVVMYLKLQDITKLHRSASLSLY